MASAPSFNPNSLRSSASAERLKSDSSDPLVNRAVEFGYAPGSTFKLVTATAAIDTGAFTPESTLSGRNDVLVSGVPLGNDDDESYGQITLTEALTKSVNTVWAQVAEHRGQRDVELDQLVALVVCADRLLIASQILSAVALSGVQ